MAALGARRSEAEVAVMPGLPNKPLQASAHCVPAFVNRSQLPRLRGASRGFGWQAAALSFSGEGGPPEICGKRVVPVYDYANLNVRRQSRMFDRECRQKTIFALCSSIFAASSFGTFSKSFQCANLPLA